MLYARTVRVARLRRGLDHESEGSRAQVLLGLSASHPGVETSGSSCLCSQLLLTAKRWQDKLGLSFRLSSAPLAVLAPARPRWPCELKCPFCCWSDPNQWGIAAEPRPRFIVRLLDLTWIDSFMLNRHELFVWCQF